MDKYIVIIPGRSFGPYVEEAKAMRIRDRFADKYGYSNAVIMPLERINWKTIPKRRYSSSRATKSSITKTLLNDIFAEPGTAIPAAEVRAKIQEQGGVTGSYLSNIRQDMGIRARQIRKAGINGVGYWEWYRDELSVITQDPEPIEETLDDYTEVWIPETQQWVSEEEYQHILEQQRQGASLELEPIGEQEEQ
jgi:hypothetical protein